VSAAPIVDEDTQIEVTISVGIATTQGEAGIDLEELTRRADRALYAAKRGGRDRVELDG
jgi:diguanylate cyclase (GGDEF)-like protein